MANQWTWAGDQSIGGNLSVFGTAAIAPTSGSYGTAVAISAVAEDVNNIVTLTVAASSFAVNDAVKLTGLTVATWLNGYTVRLVFPTTSTTLTFFDPTEEVTSGPNPPTPTTPETGTATPSFPAFTITGSTGDNDLQSWIPNGTTVPAI